MERPGVAIGPALNSLQAAVPRFTSLLRQVPDPDAAAIGTWSAGDVASHVASVFDNYVAMVRESEPALAATTADIGRLNSAWLEEDTQRDPRRASARVEAAFDRLTKQLSGSPHDHSIPWHAGLSLPLATVLCLALGEILVHGHDIASASGTRWSIPPDEARMVLAGIIELAPHYVDEVAARNLSARYELRIRGGMSATLSFEAGKLVLNTPGGRADCKISAEPVAFLLVAYGRVSVWGPALRGKMVAWGRRPLLGLKLPSLLRNP